MALPFKKLDHHRIYKNTFLQCVYLVMAYTRKPDYFFDDAYYKRLLSYVTDKFHLIDYNEEKARAKKDFFRLNNKKDGITYEFNNGRVVVMIENKRYRSFVDSVIPVIYRLIPYLKEVMMVECLNQVAEKKINFWLADQNLPEGTEFDYNHLEKLVLSENVMLDKKSRMTSAPDKFGRQLFWKNEWVKEETGGKVTIRVSRMKMKDNKKRGCIILDSDVCDKDVKTFDLPNCLMEANGILYDAFHWSVTDMVLEIMQGTFKPYNDGKENENNADK